MPGAHEERRLVTCVFLDIVGSTDLTLRLGPERLKRALDAAFGEVQARITAEGGTVEKYIGDAVYALFGAPVAHADDPLRALRAAQACRDWAAGPDSPFGIRIGVETGEAVVDLNAVESTQQRMSVGPVVNTAARLEQAADPGQILVGPACHEATAGSARFRALGPMTFKGLAPLEVWELESVGGTQPGVDLPFVGRAGDLDILRLAYGRSAQRPVFALVSGPPGQGKTRIVRQLLGELGRSALVARFRPAGEVGGSAPLRELLGGADTDADAVAAALANVADADERERILRGVLHSAGIRHDERLARLPEEERTDESVHAWRRYFATRGEAIPVVWFEDLHWADPATIRLVDRLTLSTGPLFLIATARPEFAQQAGLRSGGDRFFVELGPLDAADATALAEQAGAADALTVERAQGNPLFIVELARTAASTGALPLTLQGALGARLDELEQADRELLSRAAVLGEAFSVADAAFLAERDPAEVATTLGRLADLLYLRRGDGAFRFHHNLLRDVAYGRLLVADRMALHARLAGERSDGLDPATRAHHWWEAVRPPDGEWVWTDPAERSRSRRAAVEAHLEAAEHALTRFDAQGALDLLARAEQLEPDPALRARIDRTWGRGAAMQGKGDVSWERFERAVAHHRAAGDAPPELYFEWLHVPVWFTGYFSSAPGTERLMELLAEGVAVAEARGDLATQARLRMVRATLVDDLAAATEAVAAAEPAVSPADHAALLSALAQQQFEHGHLDAMAESARRLGEIAERIADPDVAFASRRRVALWRGDLPEARRLATQLEGATRRAGPHIRSHTLGTLTWQAEAEGRWDETRALAEELLALMRANEGTKFCAFAGAVLAGRATAEILAGGLDEARALVARASTLTSYDVLWYPQALAALGDRRTIRKQPAGMSPHEWAGYAGSCVILGESELALEAARRLETMAERGAWLAGAMAEAIRDEVEGRGLGGPGHTRLRERGYVGTSEILTLRAGVA